jgi:hypothetical protein
MGKFKVGFKLDYEVNADNEQLALTEAIEKFVKDMQDKPFSFAEIFDYDVNSVED